MVRIKQILALLARGVKNTAQNAKCCNKHCSRNDVSTHNFIWEIYDTSGI